VSLNELEQRLLRAAHTAGWIDEDAYARTRPLVTELRLDRALGDLERVPEDPDTFLAWLRTHAAGEGALHSPALSPTD
jgi:conjugal transfer pilus assembly protein TraF